MIRSTSSPRTRFAFALAGASLLVPGLLAGCSAAGSDSPDGSSSGDSRSASAQMGQCLRDKGYDVDDPDFSKGIAVVPPSGADSEAYNDDFTTCAEGIGGELADFGTDDPAETAAWQKANLKVAQCVRDKGIEDFPDPVDGVFSQGLSTDPSDPTAAALEACDAEFGIGSDDE